jgi:hypothetical protein
MDWTSKSCFVTGKTWGWSDVGAGMPWHRRHAVHVVSELPDEREDVEIVLRLLQEIVSGFLYADEKPQPGKVLAIVREQ